MVFLLLLASLNITSTIRAMVLKHYPEGLLNTDCWHLSQSFWFSNSRVTPRIYISNISRRCWCFRSWDNTFRTPVLEKVFWIFGVSQNETQLTAPSSFTGSTYPLLQFLDYLSFSPPCSIHSFTYSIDLRMKH